MVSFCPWNRCRSQSGSYWISKTWCAKSSSRCPCDSPCFAQLAWSCHFTFVPYIHAPAPLITCSSCIFRTSNGTKLWARHRPGLPGQYTTQSNPPNNKYAHCMPSLQLFEFLHYCYHLNNAAKIFQDGSNCIQCIIHWIRKIAWSNGYFL